jgi:hypothetical protein
MGFLMKFIILILLFCKIVFASNYLFLVEEYNKELELEAKIISKIASNSLHKDVKIFIPQLEDKEKKIYSKIVALANNCDESNFVFVKRANLKKECNLTNKIFFTNDYKKLLKEDKYIGAFFWSKSRPNIVFVKNRLEKNKVTLPNDFNQYIEDFK